MSQYTSLVINFHGPQKHKMRKEFLGWFLDGGGEQEFADSDTPPFMAKMTVPELVIDLVEITDPEELAALEEVKYG